MIDKKYLEEAEERRCMAQDTIENSVRDDIADSLFPVLDDEQKLLTEVERLRRIYESRGDTLLSVLKDRDTLKKALQLMYDDVRMYGLAPNVTPQYYVDAAQEQEGKK